MPVTYENLATTTVSGTSTSSITFSSISGNYTDLIIVNTGTFNTGDNGYNLTFNGDTGSNYFTVYLYGDGTSAASIRAISQAFINAGRMNTSQSTGITHVMNYSSSSANKTILTRGNSGALVNLNAGLWKSTAAITSLTVACPAGISNFGNGTVFTLYGIKSA